MEFLHFFSHESRVSLELPVGWEELKEEKHQVIYYYESFTEDEDSRSWITNPRLMIKLFPSPSDDLQNLEKASQSNFQQSHSELDKLEHNSQTIDGHPGVLDLFRYRDIESGELVIQLQVFVLISDVLFSFTGLMTQNYEDEIIPVLKTAISSVRFIFE